MIKRSDNKWLAHQRYSKYAKLNLFCFVFAGGSPSFFAPWKNRFPEWINILPVLYPGREKRVGEIMPDKVSDLLDQFRKENASLLEKPYAIWGHCSGSLIGLEVAYAESKQGNIPQAFIISGSEAPQYALTRLQLREDFSQVKDEEILQDLLLFNLMPEEMVKDETFKKYFLPIYRSDLNMFSKYHCSDEIYLKCSALVMNGKEDLLIKSEYIPKWTQRFSEPVTFLEYSGKHYFVNDHMKKVTDDICTFLNMSLNGGEEK